MKLKYLLLLPFVSLALSANATSFYADATNGDDNNNCSKTAPCKTMFAAFAKTTSSDDVIRLAKGNYNTEDGPAALAVSKGIILEGGYDSDFNPLTRSTNPEDTLIDAGTSSNRPGIFDLSSGHDSWVVFDTVTISGANNSDGVFLTSGTGANLRLINVLMQNNTMTKNQGGGAIVLNEPGDKLEVINSRFVSNKAVGDGGGGYGGAIYITNSADVLIEKSEFEDNSASAYGGAIAVGLNTNNSAEINLTISDSLFVDNNSGWGGAINFRNTATSEALIERSSFISNKAARTNGRGGAVHATTGHTLTVVNSTFSDNEVSNQGTSGTGGIYGGAIAVTGAQLNLRYSTLVNNKATNVNNGIESCGGGLASWDGSVSSLQANIISSNTSSKQAGEDNLCYDGALTDLGYNLVGGNGVMGAYTLSGSYPDVTETAVFMHKGSNNELSSKVIDVNSYEVFEPVEYNGAVDNQIKLQTSKIVKHGMAHDAIPYDGFPYYGVGTSEGNRFTSLGQARASVGFDEFDYAPGNLFYFALGATNTAEDGYDVTGATDVFQAVMDADGWVRHAGALDTSEEYDSEMRGDVKWIRAKQAGVCSGIVSTDGRGMPRSDRVRSGEPVAVCDIGAFEYNDYYQLDCVDEDGMRPENNLNSIQAGWCFNPLDKDVNPMDVFENIGIGMFSWQWSLLLLGLLGLRFRPSR